MKALEELKAAYAAATPGRWAYDDDGFVYGDMDHTQESGGGYIVSDPHASSEADIDEREGNGTLIAIMHNNLPALIECVEALEPLLTSFGDIRSGFPERELHEPADVTADRAFNALAKLKGERK